MTITTTMTTATITTTRLGVEIYVLWGGGVVAVCMYGLTEFVWVWVWV
jgi:hypothetical protein